MDRTIIYSPAFDECVQRLGGYRTIDLALETVIDGLRGNPFGFHKFESDDFSFRYAITERLGHIAPLFLIFEINSDRTVTLVHVEEVQSY